MSELTAREKIQKYAEVEKRPDRFGDTLICGKRKLNMSKRLEQMSDAECARVAGMLELDAYIAKKERKKTEEENGRKATISPDPKPCECGCKEMTREGSRFRPGHDMRLKSALRTAVGHGDVKAKAELHSRGWD